MPSRIIREALLDSERYWSVGIEARQFFLHLILLADDLACVSLATCFLRRGCFDSHPTAQVIDKLIVELQDVDLIRVYQVSGSRFAFIPRSHQRLQRLNPKHPIPPFELVADDAHAVEQ